MTITKLTLAMAGMALMAGAATAQDDHTFTPLDNAKSVDMDMSNDMDARMNAKSPMTFSIGNHGSSLQNFNADRANNVSLATMVASAGNWQLYDEEPAIHHTQALSQHPGAAPNGIVDDIGADGIADYVNYLYEVSANHNHMSEVMVISGIDAASTLELMVSGLDLSSMKEDMSALETGGWQHPVTGSKHNAGYAHVHFDTSTGVGQDEFLHVFALETNGHTILMSANGSENEEEQVLGIFEQLLSNHRFR